MAPSTSTTRASLLPLEAKGLKRKRTDVVFYMHDWETPIKEENITNVAIAGNIRKKWSVIEFGSLFVIDDAMTEGITRNSTQLGRVHGIYVNSALDGTDLHILVSLVFTNKKFNGSTIEIQGAEKLFQQYMELSVVSGTGLFRIARGYAILETAFLENVLYLHGFIANDHLDSGLKLWSQIGLGSF